MASSIYSALSAAVAQNPNTKVGNKKLSTLVSSFEPTKSSKFHSYPIIKSEYVYHIQINGCGTITKKFTGDDFKTVLFELARKRAERDGLRFYPEKFEDMTGYNFYAGIWKEANRFLFAKAKTEVLRELKIPKVKNRNSISTYHA